MSAYKNKIVGIQVTVVSLANEALAFSLHLITYVAFMFVVRLPLDPCLGFFYFVLETTTLHSFSLIRIHGVVPGAGEVRRLEKAVHRRLEGP